MWKDQYSIIRDAIASENFLNTQGSDYMQHEHALDCSKDIVGLFIIWQDNAT